MEFSDLGHSKVRNCDPLYLYWGHLTSRTCDITPIPSKCRNWTFYTFQYLAAINSISSPSLSPSLQPRSLDSKSWRFLGLGIYTLLGVGQQLFIFSSTGITLCTVWAVRTGWITSLLEGRDTILHSSGLTKQFCWRGRQTVQWILSHLCERFTTNKHSTLVYSSSMNSVIGLLSSFM